MYLTRLAHTHTHTHTHAHTHTHTHTHTTTYTYHTYVYIILLCKHNDHLHQEDQKTEAASEYPERRDLLKSVSVYDLETVSRMSVE